MPRLKEAWKRFVASDWLFPVALFVVVALLAAFRISGTSVGLYHTSLYGAYQPDKSLIYGQPQPIRSDEWLVVTPLTVSQSHFDFPGVNPTLGTGANTTVVLDLPNRDWSEIFRPQNWSFFVLPLEQAFAFKWWLIGYLLIVSSYFLVLTFLPGRHMLAALLSLSLFFSPFFQWWYQNMTLSVVSYSCLMIVVFVRLVQATKLIRKVWLGLGLGLFYVMTCFALIIYPPFQVPCAMGVVAVCGGYLLQRSRPLHWRDVLRQLAPVLLAAIAAGVVVGAYFATRSDTIHAISNTIYPGHRVVKSGGYSLSHFLDGGFSRQLQNPLHSSHYIQNQSEDSNFIILWPYLIVPSVILLVRQWRRKRELDWPIALTNGVVLLLVAWLFLPIPAIIGKVTLLSLVPHNRLIVGIGFLNFLQLVLFLRQVGRAELPKRWVWLMAGGAFLVQIAVGLTIRREYPHYLPHLSLVLIVAILIAAIVYLVARGRVVWAAALLLVMTVWSTYRINPLYIGLGELTRTPLTEVASKEPGAHSGGWVLVGNLGLINLLPSSGLKSYSTTFMYPQMDYLHTLDPGGEYTRVYNRYGFAMYVVDKPDLHGFRLNGVDSYFVGYQPCDEVFKRYIQHVVSQTPLDKECLKLDEKVTYPNTSFFVYHTE